MNKTYSDLELEEEHLLKKGKRLNEAHLKGFKIEHPKTNKLTPLKE